MSFNYGLRPTTVQMIALSGTTSTQSAAFGSQSEYVRICSNAAVHILFGVNPTATASSIFIPANEPEIFKISPGEKVAIKGTSGDDISVVEMSAQWLNESLFILFQDQNQKKDLEDTKKI